MQNSWPPFLIFKPNYLQNIISLYIFPTSDSYLALFLYVIGKPYPTGRETQRASRKARAEKQEDPGNIAGQEQSQPENAKYPNKKKEAAQSGSAPTKQPREMK